jgi:hypothetical protein
VQIEQPADPIDRARLALAQHAKDVADVGTAPGLLRQFSGFHIPASVLRALKSQGII